VTPKPLYQVLASILIARDNCRRSGNDEWHDRYHEARAAELVKRYLPSGSGFDNGTKLDDIKSTGDSLVFDVDFHHMNEHGFYDGWTTHRVVVRPSLAFGFRLTIGGRNRNEIKDYIAEVFDAALHTPIDEAKKAEHEHPRA